MDTVSVVQAAKKWGVSERSVRNYCAQGRVPGAFLDGKTWSIPANAEKPDRLNKRTDPPKTLLDVLRAEKAAGIRGGIYHRIQIDLTYNTNHIEGCRLTHDQTRYIFETNTIGVTDNAVNVDDVVETANHFWCIDMIIDKASHALSEAFIKQLHAVLKGGTTDVRRDWFAVGDYKKLDNIIGASTVTTPAKDVYHDMTSLINSYNSKEKSFADIVDFHAVFEKIHPFQEGNGRVGRIILFKECLANDIVPPVVLDKQKVSYINALNDYFDHPQKLLRTMEKYQRQYEKQIEKYSTCL